jgi:hypothetical protein
VAALGWCPSGRFISSQAGVGRYLVALASRLSAVAPWDPWGFLSQGAVRSHLFRRGVAGARCDAGPCVFIRFFGFKGGKVSRLGRILQPRVNATLAARVMSVFEKYGLHHHNDLHTAHRIELPREAALMYDGRLDTSAELTAGRGLTTSQLRLVQEMCEDAQACVTAGIETCRACDEGLCPMHSFALARAEAYRALAMRLGADRLDPSYTLANFRDSACHSG